MAAIKNGDENEVNWLMERAIICPTNALCEEGNRILTRKFPGDPHIYRSFDKVRNSKDEKNFPTEWLNRIQLASIPDHIMELKEGMPIMLIRNLDPINGHVNGARYVILTCNKRIIHARLSIGPHKGKEILIPRIVFLPQDKSLPFEFERRQFPVRPCMNLTSNKGQGQSYNVAGINLTQDFFGHGQLYVAMSRVTHPDGLKIFKPKSTKPGDENYMRNVVYQEILTNDPLPKQSRKATSDPPDKSTLNDTFDNFDFDEFEDIELPIRADTTTIPVRDREPTFQAEENRNDLSDMYELAYCTRELPTEYRVRYHYEDVEPYLPQRLLDAGFQLSTPTLGDGNCLLYALLDQLR